MGRPVTKKQHDILRHALGYSTEKVPLRNYYKARSDCPDCAALVDKAMMVRGLSVGDSGLIIYQVTNFGELVASRTWEEEKDGDRKMDSS